MAKALAYTKPIYRLSETARLLKNVFTRRTPRIDLEVEMSRK